MTDAENSQRAYVGSSKSSRSSESLSRSCESVSSARMRLPNVMATEVEWASSGAEAPASSWMQAGASDS